jgi:hypothetical protein
MRRKLLLSATALCSLTLFDASSSFATACGIGGSGSGSPGVTGGPLGLPDPRQGLTFNQGLIGGGAVTTVIGLLLGGSAGVVVAAVGVLVGFYGAYSGLNAVMTPLTQCIDSF